MAIFALVDGGDVALAVGVRLAAVGVLALVAAIVLGWTSLVPVSVALLGSAYAMRLTADDVGLDVRGPVLAAGLLLTAELAYWSLEERDRIRAEAGEGLRHLGLAVLLAASGLIVGAVVLAAADLASAKGLAVDLLGAAAAAGALVLLLLAAREPARDSGRAR